MTVHDWLTGAIADARRRGLFELVPLLEGLATSTLALRTADFNDDASGAAPEGGTAPGTPGTPSR